MKTAAVPHPRPHRDAPDAKLGEDLRGLVQLLVCGINATTDLAETVHANVLGVPARVLGGTGGTRTHGISRLAYAAVRGTATRVGSGLDDALAKLSGQLPETAASPRRDAMLAVLNGVLGDHLLGSGNPMAIHADLRSNGTPLGRDAQGQLRAPPAATTKLLLQIHGLCMNDAQWRHQGHDHGAQLAIDHGYTAVHFHYNTGLSIASNGQMLSQLLQSLLATWPVRLERFAILAHSMGGLVARAALLAATRQSRDWVQQLDQVVFLGTPHHGAPLERAGQMLQTALGLTPWTAPFVRIGALRSAGIRDLRHGTIEDASAAAPSIFHPLPGGIRAYAVAASTQVAASTRTPRGDGLVPVASALGKHRDPRRSLRLPAAHQFRVMGTGHLALLGNPAVYRQLHHWLA